MKYSDLLENLKEITALVSSIPEKFQERCFELLLQHLIGQAEEPSKPYDASSAKATTAVPVAEGGVPLNAPLRVFMRKYDVTKAQIDSLLIFESGEVHFLREPTAEKNASAQIEWALLLAFKSAVLKGTFTVDPEDVRSICKEKGVYDQPNFASTFTYKGNAILFRGVMKPQGDPQQLSDDGTLRLSELVKKLTT